MQLIQRGSKTEFLKNIAHILRKTIEHGLQIFANVIWIFQHIDQTEFGRVKEWVATGRGKKFI